MKQMKMSAETRKFLTDKFIVALFKRDVKAAFYDELKPFAPNMTRATSDALFRHIEALFYHTHKNLERII